MKKIIILLFLLMAFTISAKASEDIAEVQKAGLNIDGLESAMPDTVRDYMHEVKIDADTDFNEGILQILGAGKDQTGGIFKEGLRSSVLLLAIVLLCGLVGAVYGAADSSSIPNFVVVAGALAIAAASLGDINSLTILGRDAIEDMDSFSKVLLPTLAAAASASGGVTSAAARHIATVFFADVLITVINRLLLSVTYAYIAACVANAALGNDALGKIASFLKWSIAAVLGIIITVFTAYLTITGVISGSADAMTIKATKLTLSGAVPVVGKVISDAAETILVGAGMLKNSIGIIGMLSVICICVTPFLKLGVHYLLYKLTAALASTISDPRLSRLIDNIGEMFGLVLAMTGSCALLMLISIISTIQAVSV